VNKPHSKRLGNVNGSNAIACMMNIRMKIRETELRHFNLEDDSCYLLGEQNKQTSLSRVQSVKKEKMYVIMFNHLFQQCTQNTIPE
jgi:hypothetical protein